MDNVYVQVEGLGKRYRIGAKRQRYRTIRETARDMALAPLRRAGRLLAGQAQGAADLTDTMWAIKDINFSIGQGDVVGIIGRNGAGKSTLLKVLSRITEPTEGEARIRGRVGSLLEVGTGFHPELTGRENVYLSGAVLGMRRFEIHRKFDEIIDFAGVEKFIETPLKHYSSGMYLRLAFAVAAHLEPEILLVDEVLAVGDAEFQRKCLNKMESVGGQGRTVFYVSHNMPTVARLCQRTIMLHQGQVAMDGPTREVVSAYLTSELGTRAMRAWDDPRTAPGNEIVRLRAMRVRDVHGEVSDAIDVRQPVGIEFEYDVLKGGQPLVPWFTLTNEEGVDVFSALNHAPAVDAQPCSPGRHRSTAWIPANLLTEGTMVISPAILTNHPRHVHFYERDAVAFQVIDPLAGDSARGQWTGQMAGVVRPVLNWETEHLTSGPAQVGTPALEEPTVTGSNR